MSLKIQTVWRLGSAWKGMGANGRSSQSTAQHLSRTLWFLIWFNSGVSALKIVGSAAGHSSIAITVQRSFLMLGLHISIYSSAFLCPPLLLSHPGQQQSLSLTLFALSTMCTYPSYLLKHFQILTVWIKSLKALLPACKSQPGNQVSCSFLDLFINVHLRVLCVCVLWKPHLFPWSFVLHQFLSLGPWLITWLLKACELAACSCLFVFLPVWPEKPALHDVCY